MPIAIGNTSAATPTNATDTLTWSHTVASGSDRYLVVAVGSRSARSVVSVTFNGDALTALRTATNSTNNFCSLWGMIAPDVATGNIVVTLDDLVDVVVSGAAADFTGVNQTTPTNGTGTGTSTGTATSASDSLTTSIDNCWLIDALFQHDDNNTITYTSISNQANIGSNADTFAMSRRGPVTPAGAFAIGSTWTNSLLFSHAVIALAPAGGTAYSLTADNLSYALSLQTVGTNVQRRLISDNLSFALSLQSLNFLSGKSLVVDHLTYSISLQDSNADYVMPANHLTFALSLQDITLTKAGLNHYTLTADNVTYTLSLQDASLVKNGAIILTADNLTYSMSLQDFALLASQRYELDVNNLEYSLSMLPVGTIWSGAPSTAGGNKGIRIKCGIGAS